MPSVKSKIFTPLNRQINHRNIYTATSLSKRKAKTSRCVFLFQTTAKHALIHAYERAFLAP